MREHPRILAVACGVFALFSVLVVQFFRVQIIQENKWQKYAKAQHELVVKEPFRRGVFYANTDLMPGQDKKDYPLVMDIPMFHLYADPFQLPPKWHQEIADKVAEILKTDHAFHDKLLSEFGHEKSRSRKLKMWLTQQEKRELFSWWFDYAKKHKIASNALYFLPDYKRAYPYDKLLGQVLHTIQENKDEHTHQGIPTGGLEYHFNELLQGVEGKTKLLRSPKHPLDLGRVIEAPQDGADIYLTFDPNLQAICEEEIEKGVKNVKAKAGWAILMDPYSGEIYAFAQYPFFSPQKYRDYYNDKDSVEHTRLKGVCDSHEPGSVTKAITMGICFLANEELKKQGKPPILDVNEKVSGKSGKFPGRAQDLKDPRPHSYYNFYHALRNSSNIYPARMIERVIKELGEDWYRKQLVETFALGEKTGIEYPQEAEGLIPKPGRLHPNGTLEWSTPTPWSLAMGHNFMVNSLQILRAFNVIANGGYLVKPTFIKKIVKRDNQGRETILMDHTTQERFASFRKVLEPYMTEEITKGLKCAVGARGSSPLADVYGYCVAGKTGTANKIVDGQYSHDQFFSSFIGFAPADHPKFILLVSIDDPKNEFKHGIGYTYWGGKCAAPVFREISRRALSYLGIPPDSPGHYPLGDPRRDKEKIKFYKERQEIAELYDKWNSKK